MSEFNIDYDKLFIPFPAYLQINSFSGFANQMLSVSEFSS